MILPLVVLGAAVSALLVGGAYAVERLVRPLRLPTRFVWAGALLATLVLVALAPVRAVRPAAETAGVVALPAIDVFAVDAALAGATSAAERWLPVWSGTALLVGWAAASLLALFYFVGGALRHRRVLAEASPALVAGTPVRVSDAFGPAVVGVRQATIVLPRWLLSRRADEQALVVAHEREHIAAHDPLLLLAGAASVVAMPWNPLLWWAFTRLRLAMELDCDARVLRAGAPPLAYGSLLLDLTAALPPARLGAPSFAARPSQLESRILAMTTPSLSTRRRAATAVAATFTAVLVSVAACSAEVSDTALPPEVQATRAAAAGGPLAVGEPYFDFQVEKPVAPIPGDGAPRYPAILRSAGMEGEVLAQFVVDTLGRVEAESFKVIRKTHDLFEMSVRSALPAMRFTPAEVGGRKVRQLVQQPFVFQLAR